MAIGVALVIVGGLWTLQGVGMVGGSFMTGSARWLFVGLVCILIGLVVLITGSRRRR